MDKELLRLLLAEVDKPVARYSILESYYYGTQQNGLLTAEQRKLLGNRLSRLSVNVCKVAVTSLSERLSVKGFSGADVYPDWIRLDFDQLQDVLHKEALTLSESWVVVWQRDGKPFATVESAWNMACIRDAGTREITSAIKRWDTGNTTEATVFTATKIFKLRANRTGATAASDFTVYETLTNPLGVVPVVCFQNLDRFEARSELDDLLDLVDGLNLALADLAIAQSFYARPTQWASGVTLTETPVVTTDQDGNTVPVLDGDGNPTMVATNPFPPTNRMHIAENDDAKFGEFSGSDLSGFEAAVRIWLSAIQSVTSLPPSALGVLSDQPTSGDSYRSMSMALEAKAQGKGAMFGRNWEQVARLIYAIGHPGVAVADVDVRVVWRDFGVNSFGVESDGITKLFAAKLISRQAALAMLGWDADQILADRAAMRAEALDTQGVGIHTGTAPNVAQDAAEAV